MQAACSLSLGLGEESIHASSVLVMPMVSSKITGFRGNPINQTRSFSLRALSLSSVEEDGENLLETTSMLGQGVK